MRPTSPPPFPQPGPSPSRTSAVLAIGLDPGAARRLRDGLALAARRGAELPLRLASDWLEAHLHAGCAPPLAAVFDPFSTDAAAGLPPFTGAFADVPLIAYGRLTPCCAPRLLDLLRSGVHAFVTRDVDDTPLGFVHQMRRLGLLQAERVAWVEARARPRAR